MKKYLIFIFLFLFIFNISWAQTLERRTAVITSLKGSVYVKRAGSEIFTPAKLNMALSPGDRIWVQANSYAVLAFSDKSTLRLSSNTQLDIVELSKEEDKEKSIFKLWIGKIWATVERILKPGERVEIQTPTAVAGVRGTSWVMDVLEDGTTFVNSLSGIVSLIAGGIEKNLKEGFKTVINPDGTFGKEDPFNVQEYIKELEKEIEQVKEVIKEELKEAKEVTPEEMEKMKPETKTQLLKSEAGYGMEIRDGEMFMKLAFTPELNFNIVKLGLELSLLTNGEGNTFFEIGFRYGEINLPSFGVRYGTIDGYNLGYGLIANRYSTNQLDSFRIRLEKPNQFGVNLLIPSPFKLRLVWNPSKGIQYELSENPLTTYGIRVFYRPLAKLELGINAMADLDATYTKQQLIAGVDAGYFITKDIVAYASFAQRIIHNGINFTIDPNVASENGLIAGIKANFLGFIEAQIQLRSISDNFTFGYFDAFYEKNKAKDNLPAITPPTKRINGILAGLNAKIMNIAELLVLYEAYENLFPSLHGELAVRIGPRINGQLIYEQKNIPLGPFSFITENTKIYGQVQYPLAQNIDIIIKILRTFDSQGNPIDYYTVDTKIYF
ncbi:MAG: FecR family protein [Dictyoglomus sp.]|nr:FecR family protein [Dictyoglomus sp.]MDW8188686.1 FecR family protein [Dictyoglomus sp.]